MKVANGVGEFVNRVEGDIEVAEGLDLGDHIWEILEFVVGDVERDEAAQTREVPGEFFDTVVLEEEVGEAGDVVEVGFVEICDAVGGEVEPVECDAGSDTLWNAFHRHVGEPQLPEGSTRLYKIEWDLEHWVSRKPK